MGDFACPQCNSSAPPVVTEQVSAAGWIVFVVLIFMCLPLCWIPFVVSGLKEPVRRCGSCGMRLS
jgi:hypothetical protein